MSTSIVADADASVRVPLKEKTNKPLAPKQAKGKAANLNVSVHEGDENLTSTYTKLTQHEHVLLRPDTYIGSVQPRPEKMWVHDTAEGMVVREISYTPGLLKIFDEILVNAADNKERDPTMTAIKVTIDPVANVISVWNDGKGIPIAVHQEENCFIPELIFGHLLTSTNYNDDEKKVVGGRNGYGAKLANIFSTEFMVETVDSSRGKSYRQVWRRNMYDKEDPVIEKLAAKATDFTRITFSPDLEKFGLSSLDANTVALLRRRVYDIAGVVKNVRVDLNGERLPIKNFEGYISLFNTPQPTYYTRDGVWEVSVGPSGDGKFHQMSFVNSINTLNGGTHVNHITDQVVESLITAVTKIAKKKTSVVKPAFVKNHLSVFLNCKIVNPAFDSQTKERLTTREKDFGSSFKLPKAFIDKLVDSDILKHILAWTDVQAAKELAKTDGKSNSRRISGLPKLEDANWAGTKNSAQCTLILTEGDSAKALAVAGLSCVGRDAYGVFPLRGKVLNVREASHIQIRDNAEINAIKTIVGLKHGVTYNSVAGLRYGSILIMTDQDADGSHIKGLIINLFHVNWPELLKIGFVRVFITPIVKVSRRSEALCFYTVPQFDNWKKAEEERTAKDVKTSGWKVKYYKGLGTSSAAEAKEYFSNLDEHLKYMIWDDTADDRIDLAFNKKRADDRKIWLRALAPNTFLDQTDNQIPFSDFVDKELILFSNGDNVRSIPSCIDGLKPGHRKILFACFKRNLTQEIKVAQLAGYVAEHSAYHHGEVSLASTIVNMAQSYVGSNNVNYLLPIGQFGSRHQGGEDAASPRYIFTSLNKVTRALFRPEDDAILNYLNDDGDSIEPNYYLPILPTVLINGAHGIGTGWSTSVPSYNPRDLAAAIVAKLDGEEPAALVPYYKHFTGTIEPRMGRGGVVNGYEVSGAYKIINDTTIDIVELPAQTWTQKYKETLEGFIIGSSSPSAAQAHSNPTAGGAAANNGGEGGSAANTSAAPTHFITGFSEFHTDSGVLFRVTLPPGKIAELEASKGGIMKAFKLTTSIATSNFHLFDKNGFIHHYESPNEILDEFFGLRLEYYGKRKGYMWDVLSNDVEKLRNKVRFIKAVISGELKVSNRKKSDILADLVRSKYRAFPPPKKANEAGGAAAAKDEDDESSEATSGDSGGASAADYNYLLSMQLWTLSYEKITALEAQLQQKNAELTALEETSPEDMWRKDIKEFLEILEKQEEEEIAEFVEPSAEAVGKKGKKGGKAAAATQKKNAAVKKARRARGGDDDDDDDDAQYDDESDSFDCDDSESDYEEPAAAKKKARNKGAAAPAAKVAAAPIIARAPAAVVKANAAPAIVVASSGGVKSASTKPAPLAVSSAKAPAAAIAIAADEDSEPEAVTMSLAQRLAAKAANNRPNASASSSSSSSASSSLSSSSMAAPLSTKSNAVSGPAKATMALAPPAASKSNNNKRRAMDSGSEDDLGLSTDDDDDDDDDDAFEDEGSEYEESSKKSKKTKATTGPTTAKPKPEAKAVVTQVTALLPPPPKKDSTTAGASGGQPTKKAAAGVNAGGSAALAADALAVPSSSSSSLSSGSGPAAKKSKSNTAPVNPPSPVAREKVEVKQVKVQPIVAAKAAAKEAAAKAPPKKKAAPAPAPARRRAATIGSDDEDYSAYSVSDRENVGNKPETPKPARAKRAAAAKVVKYVASPSDSIFDSLDESYSEEAADSDSDFADDD